MENSGFHRYALVLDYDGTDFFGWQIQPNQRTVQGQIEMVLRKILKGFEGIVGCGRTDTGVHASHYYAHFDLPQALDFDLLYKLNKMLPDDIAVHQVLEVKSDFHARFNATNRSYQYSIHTKKEVFNRRFSYYYPRFSKLNQTAMSEACELIKSFDEFAPFCKTNSDVETKKCRLDLAHWTFDEENHQAHFQIQANRFLRGMVRLIVGMCINVGEERVHIPELQEAMLTQIPLKLNWSVPANGLRLEKIRYD